MGVQIGVVVNLKLNMVIRGKTMQEIQCHHKWCVVIAVRVAGFRNEVADYVHV